MNINDDVEPTAMSFPEKRETTRSTATSKFIDMNHTRNSKMNTTTKQSITALWKGVSSLSASIGENIDDISVSPKNMVGAQIKLKMKMHEQIQLEARLVKLKKEDEKMNKRINESLRRQQFVKEMHAEKFKRE